jgi:hypothetical protein
MEPAFGPDLRGCALPDALGAVRAAIYEKHVFTLTFPYGRSPKTGFGPDAECYYGSLFFPGAKWSLRDLVAVSAALHGNGTASQPS